MANLSTWSKPIPPKWLDNHESPEAFALEYKRLTTGEWKLLAGALEDFKGDAEALAKVYGPYVRGPLRHPAAAAGTPALVVDGVAVLEGDLVGLMRVGLQEPAMLHRRLLDEIEATLFHDVNGLPKDALGESSGSRGGASTTRADPTEAASPAPVATA